MVASKNTSESEDSNGRNGLDPAALQYLVANQKGQVNDPATQVSDDDKSLAPIADFDRALAYASMHGRTGRAVRAVTLRPWRRTKNAVGLRMPSD